MSSFFTSLKFKLALTFALFGTMISLLLSLGISLSAHKLGERLMDETLHAELDDYISRRARNPNSLPPATLSIRGYVLAKGQSGDTLPPELRPLQEGTYRLSIGDTPYRVAVTDKNGERYFMLFNELRQQRREEMFSIYLTTGALTMILLSAWAGWWLAGRGVAPIAELARRVGSATPEDDVDTVARGFADDEIGQLARVFSGYLKRMRAFIERERNFTGDVSHELRTPLTIVQGVLELMADGKQSEEKRQERIAKMERANRDMVNLTSALLLMARENTDELVVQTCDVCEVVGTAVEMNRHLLSDKTAVEIVCHARPHIETERTLLGIVVSNLIRNAFTHTHSGTVLIAVEENKLTVSDTGSGIRGDEIGKIFQRHFKGADSTGAGIGLSLVKRICDRYHWETVIDSTEGVGTSAQLVFKAS